jgi:aldose 1-epimerase
VTIELHFGDALAQVEPRGGRLVRYRVAGREVLGTVMGACPTAYSGALLAPWPNRLPGGRWTWQGQELHVPVNDPGTGAALHGLVHDAPFLTEAADPDRVRLSHGLAARPGYPFPLRVVAEYTLSAAGLACSLTAVNVGTEPAPVGLGAHPYVDAPRTVDELSLQLSARTAHVLDDKGRRQPSYAVAGTDVDFRQPRRLGPRRLDTAFTDLDRDVRAVVSVPLERDVVLTAGATCRWLMAFTGDVDDDAVARRGLALEPMTCAPGDLSGADVLQPGASLQLQWGWSVA